MTIRKSTSTVMSIRKAQNNTVNTLKRFTHRLVMSWREGEIETGYVLEKGRDRDWLCHGERER